MTYVRKIDPEWKPTESPELPVGGTIWVDEAAVLVAQGKAEIVSEKTSEKSAEKKAE